MGAGTLDKVSEEQESIEGEYEGNKGEGSNDNTEESPKMDGEIVENDTDAIRYSSTIPYQLVNLRIEEINLEGATITALEAWELNLYIGTSKGEIIHYYRIDEELGYIQISRQTFSSSSSLPIQKMILLPTISIILVQSSSRVSGYLLPELSPANIGKIKDVVDMSYDFSKLTLDKTGENKIVQNTASKNGPFVNVSLFTTNSVKVIRIDKNAMRLQKEVPFEGLQRGIQFGPSVVVAGEKYEVLNLENLYRSMLFPVSCDNDLVPRIAYVEGNELLLISGGNMSDPAMGMFVNRKGDAVRGTLILEKYPTSVSVEFPYVMVTLDKKLVVYSITDQSKLQEIVFPENLCLINTSRIFEVKDSALAEKIVKIPVVSTMDNDEIEQIALEADISAKKAVCKSSSLLVHPDGKFIKIMKPVSEIERWLNTFDSSTTSTCMNIYDRLFEELKDSDFLATLLFLFTLYYDLYDQALEVWTIYPTDPRLMIYVYNNLCSDGIYGTVWLYQSLVEKMEFIGRKEKSKGFESFYRHFLESSLTSKYGQNEEHIIKSVEIALTKVAITTGEALGPIIEKIKHSNNEIVELLLLNKKYYALAKLYANTMDHRQMLYYFKGLIIGDFEDPEYESNFKEVEKSLQFLINYIFTHCSDDRNIIENYATWMLVDYPSYGLKLVTDRRMGGIDVNDIKFLTLLKDSRLKLQYLEYVCLIKDEKQFLGDLTLIYLELLISSYENDQKIKDAITTANEKYLAMDVPKISIYKYWRVVEKMDLDQKFIHYHTQLYHQIYSTTLNVKSILDRKPVVETCKIKLIESKYRDTFPLLSIIIFSKYEDYKSVVNEFIILKDYISAEEFSISLSLDAFHSVESPEVNQLGSLSKALQKDVSDGLLKSIFEVYLKNNETMLIDRFLNKYDLLNDIASDQEKTTDRIDKFVGVLNKVPDNFPLSRMKRFVINNIIEFSDYNTQINVKRSLVKVEVNRLDRLKNSLKKDN